MSVKRIILIVLSIVMVLSSVSFAATGDGNEVVEPMYAIDLSMAVKLDFKDDIANCKLNMRAPSSDADRAIVRIVLEKQNGTSYTVVKTWRDQAVSFKADCTASITRQYQVTESGNYRIRVSGTIYKNNQVVETFSDKVSNIVYH